MASASLPSKTASVFIEETGGTEVLQYKTDLPIPQLKPGQILVRNEFIGINYIDTYFRTGLYKAPHLPFTLGREASGVVQSVSSEGETYSLKAGDRVAYMADGTYAEYVAAPAEKAIKIPEGVSTKDAAAALLQALTAWTLIHDAHKVEKGDWILVHAAAGGVGQWLVQMLKYIGAKVIATCSSPKVDLVKSIGADEVIDYTTEDFVKRVNEITNGEGVPAVFDSVGKSTFDGSLACVARKGSLVSFGNSSGSPEPLVISRLTARNTKVMRPTLMHYITTREEFETNSNDVFNFLLKGHVKQAIHEVYPLKDAARAHQDLESRKTTGKLLFAP